MNKLIIIGIVSLTGLSGCQTLSEQTGVLIGHPANPNSKKGKPLPLTRTLDVEDDNSDPFQPQSRNNPVPKNTDGDHSNHKMHKP